LKLLLKRCGQCRNNMIVYIRTNLGSYRPTLGCTNKL